MSLNYREIDQILEEISLKGSRIDRFSQPDRFSLLLETWSPGKKQKIIIALHHGAVRLNRTERDWPRPPRPFRFTQLLNSRMKGGIITGAEQPGGERLVHIRVRCRGELFNLWIRLWSGNPNIILSDENNRIIDVLYRKPEKKEEAGAQFLPDPQALTRPGKNTVRGIRDYSGFTDLNSCIDTLYNGTGTPTSEEKRRKRIISVLIKRIEKFNIVQKRLNGKKELFSSYDEIKLNGELIISNIWRLKKGDEVLETEDYRTGQKITVNLKKELIPRENAEYYFKKYHRFRKSLDRINRDILENTTRLKESEEILDQIGTQTDPDLLIDLEKKLFSSPGNRKEKKLSGTGLLFHSGEFTILVGRNSRENDELLRRQVKGNDLWFHMRDYPGGFVFIKAIKGKSIPLETLLDAANLALLYSGGKRGISGDIHYTEVKNLRRVKGGKPGQVLVHQDKNIHIQFDMARIKRLQGESDLATEQPKGNN